MFGPRGVALQTQSCSEYETIEIAAADSSDEDLSKLRQTFNDDNLDAQYSKDPKELRQIMHILREKLRLANLNQGKYYIELG